MSVLAPVPRLALTIEEAAAALDMSESHFRRHVLPDLKVVRPNVACPIGVKVLERWADDAGDREPVEPLPSHRPPVRGIAREYDRVLRFDPCAYCGAPCEHVDHIDPVAMGGDSEWTNLTASCARCNNSKHTRPLRRFMLEGSA